ncbi:MAG: ChbG/HpnK family deacetylase, partial [Limisphaerales bacterium]
MPPVSSTLNSELRTPNSGRRLIVNADDFGRSHSINEAVIRAHREGILTTASLM